MAILTTFPEALDNAAWLKTRTTISVDDITAPDGTATVDKVVDTVDNDTHIITQGPVYDASAPVMSSVFVQAAEITEFAMCWDSIAALFVWFDLSGLTVGTSGGFGGTVHDAGIVDYGDGFYRCWANVTKDNATSSLYYLGSGSETSTYIGNGSDGMYFWGSYTENGSTLNPYVSVGGTTVVPFGSATDRIISGITSSVTRNVTRGVTESWSN